MPPGQCAKANFLIGADTLMPTNVRPKVDGEVFPGLTFIGSLNVLGNSQFLQKLT